MKRTRQAEGCGCCGSRLGFNTNVSGVWICSKCGGINGSCYRGDAYNFVNLTSMQSDCPPERQRYFDLTVLGSDGVRRVHGFFDVETKSVVQFG